MINTDFQLKLCKQLNAIIVALGGTPINVSLYDNMGAFTTAANAIIATGVI